MLPIKFRFIWSSGYRGEDWKKIGQSETRIACGGHVCQWIGTNQVSVHLGKRFQRRRFFRNQPIRNKNGLWRPCLLTDWDEMSYLYRGSSIDASYQVSVHLAEGFQRRRLKCEKLTDDRRRMPSDGKSSHCLWQGELKNQRCYTYGIIMLQHTVNCEKLFDSKFQRR